MIYLVSVLFRYAEYQRYSTRNAKKAKKSKRRETAEMKKHIIKMCAVVLSGILCLQSGIQGNAAQISRTDKEETVVAAEPYLITTGSAIELYNNCYRIQAQEDEKENIVVPVVVSNSGLVAYDIQLLGNVVSKGSISVTVYGDKKCKEIIQKQKTYSLKAGQKKSIANSLYLKKGQKCYVKIEVSKQLQVEEEAYRFQLRLQEYNSGNRTLKNKTEVFSYQNGKGTKIYYKIKVKKTGILTIDTNYDEYSYGTPKITLCNNKKQAISAGCGICITNSAKVKKKKATPVGKNIFGVSEGVYYLKLSGVQGTYKIKSTFSAVEENGGQKKAKAQSLILGGKQIKGVILTSDKKTEYDWYKFTLEESDKIRIDFQGSTSGSEKLQLEVIPPSSAEFTRKAVLGFSGIDGNGSGKSVDEWPAGTYYLKINKTTAKGTGIYYLKVKTY